MQKLTSLAYSGSIIFLLPFSIIFVTNDPFFAASSLPNFSLCSSFNAFFFNLYAILKDLTPYFKIVTIF